MGNSSPWLAISIGSMMGGFVPLLWGTGEFSFATVLFGGIGAFVGLWIHYRMNQ